MIRPLSLLVGRTCSYQTEHHELGSWLFQTGLLLGAWQAQGLTGPVWSRVDIRHRIHQSRNVIARFAVEKQCDYLLFVDGDMKPDFRVYNELLTQEEQPDARRWAKPFLTSSLEFMRTHHCGVVGAPAVSGPPENKINVFTVDWSKTDHTGHPTDWKRMSHDEYAHTEPGFKPVVGVGTGLMLIDCNVFKKIPEPWFDDLEDQGKLDVIQSQDFVFCRKVNAAEIPVYANLFAPARHIKYEGQDPPDYIGPKPCKPPEPTTSKKSLSPAEQPKATPSLLPVLPSLR